MSINRELTTEEKQILEEVAQWVDRANKYPSSKTYYHFLLHKLKDTVTASGLNHPDVAEEICHIAGFLQIEHNSDGAEKLQRIALSIRESSLGPDHPDTAKSLLEVSRHLYSEEQIPEVESLLLRAVAILEKADESEGEYLSRTLEQLAQLRAVQDKLDEAKSTYIRAVSVMEKACGETRDTAEITYRFAIFLANFCSLEEAEPILLKLLKMVDGEYIGLDKLEIADYMECYAKVLKEMGREDESQAMFARVKAIWKAAGEERPDL